MKRDGRSLVKLAYLLRVRKRYQQLSTLTPIRRDKRNWMVYIYLSSTLLGTYHFLCSSMKCVGSK